MIFGICRWKRAWRGGDMHWKEEESKSIESKRNTGDRCNSEDEDVEIVNVDGMKRTKENYECGRHPEGRCNRRECKDEWMMAANDLLC